MRVIFIGGTGRSGTTLLGRLLGAHRDLAMIPFESKFLAGPGGLCDVLIGETTLDAFQELLLGRRFRNKVGRGLNMITDEATVEAAFARLRAGMGRDPWGAAAEFTHALLDPVAAAEGSSGWVDTNPSNIFHAAELLRMFPTMCLVHSVRDGRDVAVSVTRRTWGPDDLNAAIDWWGRRIRRGFDASDRIAPDRLLVVQMERLTVTDREREYRRLLEFLELDDEPDIRRHFDTEVTTSRSHVGRWRRDVPTEQQTAFEARHTAIATELRTRNRPYEPFVQERDEALQPAG